MNLFTGKWSAFREHRSSLTDYSQWLQPSVSNTSILHGAQLCEHLFNLWQFIQTWFFNPSETIRMLLTTYPWPFPAGLFLIQLHLQWLWNPTMGSQLDIYTAYSSQSGSIYWCMHPFSPTYPIQCQTKAGAYPSCHRGKMHPGQVTNYI